MITKNIFKIHPLYYLFTLIACLTGNFKNYIIFNSIVFVHELGHLSMALFYNWKVEKIIILPFGGVTIFNEDLNRPIKEEFLILIFGPIFQIIYTLIFKNNLTLLSYSKVLLIFNLIPIFPLDGSKFLNLFLNLFLSFKKSHLITIYTSFIIIALLLLKYNLNLLLHLTLLVLFFKVKKELKNHNNIFNKFLLERYIKQYKFKKIKIIKSLNTKKISRDHKHIFYDNKKYITEKELLKKKV